MPKLWNLHHKVEWVRPHGLSEMRARVLLAVSGQVPFLPAYGTDFLPTEKSDDLGVRVLPNGLVNRR